MSTGSVGTFYVGLILALLSTLLIGSGFIFKKRALIRSNTDVLRVGDGSLTYLRDWMWWIGLALFTLGEGANFIAYALAPAALVTPLGGLSVLVCATLGARFLNERMNMVTKLGCFVCLLGSTLVILHAPKEQDITSLTELKEKFFQQAFVTYGLVILTLSGVLIFYLGPRSGKTNPLVYILISASLGSISVMACKGIGISIHEAIISGTATNVLSGFFWFLLGLLLVGLVIQLYYLNRALDLFNTGLVTALLYVFFTTFVLIASAILFHEWITLKVLDYIELLIGLVLITTGVFMMTLFKDVQIIFTNAINFHSMVYASPKDKARDCVSERVVCRSLSRKQRSKSKRSCPTTQQDHLRVIPPATSDMDLESDQTITAQSFRMLLSKKSCASSDDITQPHIV